MLSLCYKVWALLADEYSLPTLFHFDCYGKM